MRALSELKMPSPPQLFLPPRPELPTPAADLTAVARPQHGPSPGSYAPVFRLNVAD